MSKQTIEHDFDDVVYSVLNADGDDLYYNTSSTKVVAVESADDAQAAVVATYKLVKVERLKVVKETKLVQT